MNSRQKYEDVTDPALLKKLNSGNNSSNDEYEDVTDPETLNKLTGKNNVQGLHGITNDLERYIKNNMWEDLYNAAKAAPSEIGGALWQGAKIPYDIAKLAMHPKTEEWPRATKNIFKGLEHGLNANAALTKYLEKHGLSYPGASKLMEFKEHGFGLGEPQSGDALLQQLPSAALTGALGELGSATGLVRTAQRGGSGVLNAAIEQQDPLANAVMASIIPKILSLKSGLKDAHEHFVKSPRKIGKELTGAEREQEAIQKALEQAEIAKTGAKGEHDYIKESAEKDTGISKPGKLLNKARESEKELPQLQQQRASIPEEPEQSALPAPSGEELIPDAKQKIDNINKIIREYLGEEQVHGEDFASKVVPYYEGVKNTETGKYEGGLKQKIGAIYDKAEEALPEKDIKVHKIADKEALQKKMDIDLPKGVFSENVRQQYMERAAEMEQGETTLVSPLKYFRSYKQDLYDSRDAYKRTFAHNVSPENFDLWKERGDFYKKSAEQKYKVMQDQLKGSKALKYLAEANHRYSTEYAPLHENPLYQHMKKHGHEGNRNIMQSLRGTTPGNDILNKLIKNNPELQRLVIGQSFATKPHLLAKPSKLTSRYANTEISRLMKQQKQHLEDLNHAEQKTPEIKAEHDRVQGAYEEAQKNIKLRKELDEKIVKMQRSIVEQREHAEKLQKAQSRANTTKSEHARINQEAKEAAKKTEKLQKAYNDAKERRTKYIMHTLTHLTGSAVTAAATGIKHHYNNTL